MRLIRPLVLASASPRRRRLLEAAGLRFEIDPVPDEAEMRWERGLEPGPFTERSARAKAAWAAERHPGAVALGADTLVVVDGAALGKPAGPEEAAHMLERLSGRAHTVVTGFALAEGARIFASRAETIVRFRPLDPETIRRYLETGEPLGKAGAYAIQGRGGALIDRVEGSYTNVVGLPLQEALDALAAFGGLEGLAASAP